MLALFDTCRQLASCAAAHADPTVIAEIREEVGIAQAALRFKQAAYRQLQRSFSAYLSTVLTGDEIFELFRGWAGQRCGCGACQCRHAGTAAAAEAGNVLGNAFMPGQRALLPSEVARAAGGL